MATEDVPSRRRSAADETFYADVAALLQPGAIRLHGAVIHTGLGSAEKSQLHELTLTVGDIVATHVHGDPSGTYVYSGNDDPEFGLNQHQGLTLDGDEFLWECQQVLRNGSFDVVIYWEATDDLAGIVTEIRDAGYATVGITENGLREV